MKYILLVLALVVLISCEDFYTPTTEDIMVGTWQVYDPVPVNKTVVEFCYDSIIKIHETIDGVVNTKEGKYSMWYTMITVTFPNDEYVIHLEMLGTYEFWFHDRNGILNKCKRTSKYRYRH